KDTKRMGKRATSRHDGPEDHAESNHALPACALCEPAKWNATKAVERHKRCTVQQAKLAVTETEIMLDGRSCHAHQRTIHEGHSVGATHRRRDAGSRGAFLGPWIIHSYFQGSLMVL